MVIGRKFEWMDAPRTIYLSHRSHGVQNIHLPIVVQRYVRREGEHTGYFWVDKGQKKSVEPPAFASPTVEQMSDTFEDFVAVHTPAYIHGLLANAPETTLRVFDFALKVRSSYPLVAEALKLWVGSRVIEKGWTMVGSETLGMDKVNDTSSPYHGLNPIPLPLDYQIDWTLIRNLKRRRDKVLRDLKAKVMKRRREDWLEVFLSVFIILNCIEQFTQHDQRYFRRNNPDVSPASPETMPCFQVPNIQAGSVLGLFQDAPVLPLGQDRYLPLPRRQQRLLAVLARLVVSQRPIFGFPRRRSRRLHCRSREGHEAAR